MYEEIFNLCRPHMSEGKAKFVAATLSEMPQESALALVESAIASKSGVPT
jgi:hypothetical protein